MSVVANVAVNVDSRGASQKLRALDAQARKTESAFGKLSSVATKLAGAFALVGATKFVFAKTAELEKQTKSLEVLTGSVQKATQIIKELQEIGRVTPFTSTELIESAKRLNAFGVETEKVVETTRRLADVSGASGAELSGLVTAYGQVIAKGRLQGEELLQFQERGVALQGELRKMYKLSGEEFQEALSKGRVSAEAVEVAIKRLTDVGGKYANGAIAQSETLSGKLSTLQDGVEQLARTIGQVLSPVIKGIFDQAIQALDAVNRLIAAGRGGGFTRAVAGIGVSITGGATSEAIDRAERLLSQISSQKNKAGIEQNLQALNQLSRALTRIRPEDVNAEKAVKLQGKILQLRAENVKALESLPATRTAKTTQVPDLLGGNAKGRKGARSRRSEEDKAAALLKQQLETGLKLSREFERQLLLRQAGSEFERELLQIEFDREDRSREIANALGRQRDELRSMSDEIADFETMDAVLTKVFGETAEMKNMFDAIDKMNADLAEKVTSPWKELGEQVFPRIGMALEDALVGTIEAALDGSKNLAESLQQIASSLLGDIGRMFIRSGISGLGGALGLPFAEGGFVTGPTRALIGEGSQPEYVIPENKMDEAMSRYNAGARGSSVIPGRGGGATSGGVSGGGAVINYNGPTLNFNSEDYVPTSAVAGIIDEATKRGAKAGEARTFATLRNSRSQRSRIGMGR